MAKEDIIKHQFPKGKSGNPKGRPEGAISVKARLKKMFREDPEKFEKFIERYLKNPNNEKHVTEMLDGKPQQSIDMEVTLPKPIMDITNLKEDDEEMSDLQE